VRHPIYTGLVLGALGWSFFRGSWLGLLLTAVLGVFFDRKAAREELWLEEAFPEYHSYKHRVRKLLPWVY
jgi:protein-S-isoprenylcysteine O-methyltransferase Ste14